jgi:hypothetical protein
MNIQLVKTELLHAEKTDRHRHDEAVHNSVIVTNKAEIM